MLTHVRVYVDVYLETAGACDMRLGVVADVEMQVLHHVRTREETLDERAKEKMVHHLDRFYTSVHRVRDIPRRTTHGALGSMGMVVRRLEMFRVPKRHTVVGTDVDGFHRMLLKLSQYLLD